MIEGTVQALAVKKCLELSEEEAEKVLIFIAGMEAGVKLNSGQKPKNNGDKEFS